MRIDTTPRYIDADVAKLKLKLLPQCGGEILLRSALDAIDSTPTVDVSKVRHGYWISRDVHGLMREIECSVCGSKTRYSFQNYHLMRYTDYCGDCGALMNAEKKE